MLNFDYRALGGSGNSQEQNSSGQNSGWGARGDWGRPNSEQNHQVQDGGILMFRPCKANLGANVGEMVYYTVELDDKYLDMNNGAGVSLDEIRWKFILSNWSRNSEQNQQMQVRGGGFNFGDSGGWAIPASEDLAIDTGEAAAWIEKGDVFKKQNNHPEAIKCYDKALEIDPKDAAAWNNKGNAYNNLKEYQNAIKCYDKALEIDSKNAPVWFNKGLAYLRLKRYPEAIKCYDKGLEIDSKNAPVWFNKGVSYARLNQYTEAIKCFDKVLEIDSKDALAWSNKGRAYADLNQYTEAIKCYDQALAIDPKYGLAWSNKGVLLYKQKNYREALEHYEESLKITPNRFHVLFNKSLVFYDTERMDEALECFKQAVQAEPDWKNKIQKYSYSQDEIEKLHKLDNLNNHVRDGGVDNDKDGFVFKFDDMEENGGEEEGEGEEEAEDTNDTIEAITVKQPEKQQHGLCEINSSELKLDKSIGAGGFGTVCKGSWRNNNVAIKILHVQNPSIQKEFINEAEMMAKFDHPGIIKIFGICMEPSKYCMVMELMPNGSLNDILKSDKPLPWTIRYNIVMDITHALSYLHANKTVHHDLKSHNVLLDDKLRAKLCDFGLAKTRNTTKTLSRSAAKDSAGTINWMAPELFGIDPKYTAASDTYSYAVILTELASRKLPWGNTLDLVIISEVKNGMRPEIPGNCPGSLQHLIKHCWVQDPMKRITVAQAETFLQLPDVSNDIKNH